MKKMLLLSVVLVSGMFVAAGSAVAATYSYDFSELGLTGGQSVEGSSFGLATVTSEGGAAYYTESYGAGIGCDPGSGHTSDMYFQFSEAVDSVSFRAGDGAGDSDAFRISLYEFGTDDFLGYWDSPVFGGANEPEWYTLAVSVSNIGRVVFDPGNGGSLPGVYGPPYGGVLITDFSYDTASAPVPEPGTMMLLGSGLAGLAAYGRKRFRK